MRKILRRSKFGYVLGVIIFLIGFSAIIIAFWEIWSETGSFNEFLSAFWDILWTKEMEIAAGASFKLIFLLIFGMTAMIFSVIILAFSRKWFVAGEKVLVECPFCKRRWRTDPQKALVHCPYCRQLIHPKIVE